MRKYQMMMLFLLIPIFVMGWKLESDIGLSLSQSAYSDSWAGTENSNFNWIATSNSSAEKQLSAGILNRNTLKLSFGQTHQQKVNAANEKYWAKPEKSADKIDLESILRFTKAGYLDPFVAARLETQFLDLSDNTKTRSFNPMLFTESAGVIRNIIEKDNTVLSARFGAALRQKLDRDVLQIDGTRETQSGTDGGLEVVSEFRHSFVSPDLNYRSKLQVYQALFNSKSDELNEDWKSPDLVWENVLTTRLWGIVSASFTFEARYEKETIHELQWKQLLGLGVSYSLF